MLQRSVITRVFCGLALSASVLGLSSAALAGTANSVAATVAPTDDPIAHYRAYEAAIARGDLEAASMAAVTAWRTGERVWNGNNPNLPGLAFNAAWSLGLVNKMGEAREPARRAVALAAVSPDKVNPKEAAFLLAYADMMVTPTKATVENLDKATLVLDGGGWEDFLLASAYIDGARAALGLQMTRTGINLIGRGQVEAKRIMPSNLNMLTNFLILKTQSSLQLREYSQAVRDIMDARRVYGVPKSERDINWAALAAWEAASRAIHESVRGPNLNTGTRLSRADNLPEWDVAEARLLTGKPAECAAIDIPRRGRSGPQGIRFPSREQRDMFAGGAYVRAFLDDAGKVVRTDVLSSLPRPAFGLAAQEGIQSWQYDIPPSTPAQCKVVDVTVIYAFTQ